MNHKQKKQTNDVQRKKSWSKDGCMSLFTCCLKIPGDKYDGNVFYNADKYEYAVEKLLIKRIPLALFATVQDREEHDCNSDIQQLRVSNPIKSSADDEIQAFNSVLRNQLKETMCISGKASNGSRWYRHKRSKLRNQNSTTWEKTLQELKSSDVNFQNHSTQPISQQAKISPDYIVAPMQFNWNRNVVEKLKMRAAEFEQLFSLHEQNNSSQLDVHDNIHSVKELLAGDRSDLSHNGNSNDIESTTLKWRITIKHRQPDASTNESTKTFPFIDMLRFSRNQDNNNY